MLRRNVSLGLALVLIGILAATVLMTASADDIRVATAAMKGDKDGVRNLVKQAADVNAAQGDGMTALHWAAMNKDAEMTEMLLYAGANVRATTRIGGYTPLFMAAKSGAGPVIDALLKAGADPKTKGTDGLTPLMVAAMAGDRQSVRLLLEHGADIDAKESEHGQTPLIFAAAFDRPDAIDELAKHGADLNLATVVQAPVQQQRGGGGQGQGQPPAPVPGAAPAVAAAPVAAAANTPAPAAPAAPAPANPVARQRAPQPGAAAAAPVPAAPGTPAPAAVAVAGGGQPPVAAANNPRGGGNAHGGLTPLMYAARDGHMSAIHALVDAGAPLDTVSADKSTALLLTTINGHFDIAKYLVERGADVSISSVDEATPLYGIVHVQWSRESGRPQPSIKREETGYLDLMKLMMDHGADPNAKLGKTLWYTSYGYAYESTNVAGTTAFWKCAEVGDIDGMRLLLSRGADPTVSNKDGVTALLIASGAGTHGNDDIMAPPGRMASLRYLVEELHMDVNAAENGTAARGGDFGQMGGGQGVVPPVVAGAPPVAGQPQPAVQRAGGGQGAQPEVFVGGGFTALHNAASRGDNEMILYLVAHGAKVDAVTKSGISVVDQANGPRQRVQPYASTIALLEMLGATNSHKCVSC